MPTRFEWDEEPIVQGFRSDVVDTEWRTLGEGISGTRAWGAGAETLEFISSAAADDVGSTGATKVKLLYVDGNGDYQTSSAEHNLDGINPSALAAGVADLQAIMGIFASSVGSGKTNAGDVTVRVASGGASRAKMRAGANAWHPGRFYVPNGKVAILSEFYAELAAASASLAAEFAVEADVAPDSWGKGTVATRVADVFTQLFAHPTKSAVFKQFGRAIILPEKTCVRLRGRLLSSGSAPAGGSLSLRLSAA